MEISSVDDSVETTEMATNQRIEETVKSILSEADMDLMTEFKLRVAASSILGFDLSAANHVKLVRDVLETFLLSTSTANIADGVVTVPETVSPAIKETVAPAIKETVAPAIKETVAPAIKETVVPAIKETVVPAIKETVAPAIKETVAQAIKETSCDPPPPASATATAAAVSSGREEKRFIFKLSEIRDVAVERGRGKALLSIGKWTSHAVKKPFRGKHFPVKQWNIIKSNFTAIDEAIKHFQSKVNPESKQNGDAYEVEDKNNTLTFSPIETSRFDGTSYLCWATQMKLFLNQLNLTYVLSEPYPGSSSSSSSGPESNPDEISQADASEKDWLRDDYFCHNHLLNSLSDHLYRQYSKKFKHARELWDELKWVYQCKESSSKRSQVRKYNEFKMVEERPILEQVQDFNKIADSIISAGMFLDETFHVSTIISKLPSSWRGFCNRLMEEEFLPVWMLMERVKSEEELLKNGPQGVTYRPATGSSQMERRPSLGTTDRGTQSIGWKRKEPERDGRETVVCENSGRKGHLTENCWGKKPDKRAFEKPNRVASSVIAPVVSDSEATTKMTESSS